MFVEPQEEAGPSGQQKETESKTEEVHVPMFITYERGTRMLFSATKRVLSPPGVEGISLSSPDHRQMLSSPRVKGALLSSPDKQV